MDRLIIIMPTHKSYLDVAALSEQLYLKFWPKCPFKIILSTNSTDCHFSLFKCFENAESDEYIRRIYNAANSFDSEFYMIIGEDNFVTYEIDEKLIYYTLDYMKHNNINYCRFIPPEEKKPDLIFTPIRRNKPYGITGAGFICTKEYINKEMKENINGWAFENEMLKETLSFTNHDYFSDYVAASQDILNTVHGIRHGMWIPSSYKLLKRLNPEFDFDVRPVAKEDFKYYIREKSGDLYKVLPTKTRYRIKKLLKKIGFRFATDF